MYAPYAPPVMPAPRPPWRWYWPLGAWTQLFLYIPCLWPITVVWYIGGAGLALAGWMFKPRRLTVGVHGTVVFLQTARTVTGVLIMLGLYVTYVEQGAGQLANDQWAKTVFTIGVALVAIIVGVVVFARLTADRAMRADLLRRAFTRPPLMILALLLAWGAFILWGESVGMFDTGDEMSRAEGWFGLIGLTFMIPFQARAAFMVSRDIFGAAEVHPLLPSVLAPCIAWTMTIIEFVFPGPLPGTIATVVAIGGPVTVTILAIAEGNLLRKLEGVSVRGGPYPASTTAVV